VVKAQLVEAAIDIELTFQSWIFRDCGRKVIDRRCIFAALQCIAGAQRLRSGRKSAVELPPCPDLARAGPNLAQAGPNSLRNGAAAITTLSDSIEVRPGFREPAERPD
jgi:hypothetical protein